MTETSVEGKGPTRSPICVVAGHVDHGKSSILDYIRGTSIVAGEAGAITQAIGASHIPLEVIKKHCWSLIKDFKLNISIPGILFIDTPGHAAFTNLRKRGGNLADIAILVVDLNEGFKPQTIEALDILRTYKTPFIVAANKLDLMPGWQKRDGMLLANISAQQDSVKHELDKRLYNLVGKLSEHGFNSERFDRIQDASNQIMIVPCSAKIGVGIPELLMTLSGLTQRFLEKAMAFNVTGLAKGTILEVKEVKGSGTCVDVVLYDGVINTNDTIVVGAIPEPIITKVRGIFEPSSLREIRDKKAPFTSVKSAVAACAIRIVAPELDNALGGMPVRACKADEAKEIAAKIKEEIEEVLVKTDKEGIVAKADSLGSLEAMVHLLRENGVKIKKAAIGNITKKDVTEAEGNLDKKPEDAIVIGFSVNIEPDVVMKEHVKVITHDVIYSLIDDFEKWKKEVSKRLESKELVTIGKPFKIELLEGYVFRQNNPAVVGCEVIDGKVRAGAALMKDGREVDIVKAMQHERKNVTEAEKGKQVAISFPHSTVGRQIHEKDILYSFFTEKEFRKLKELKKQLDPEEREILKEIAEIMRKNNPLWGV